MPAHPSTDPHGQPKGGGAPVEKIEARMFQAPSPGHGSSRAGKPWKPDVIAKLQAARTLEQLKRTWGSLGIDYQRDPEIAATKDRMKDQLG